MKIFRWMAIVPMALLAALVVVFWMRYVDLVIRRSIEFVGTELVGAKVELASARLRLRSADLVLRGLQVTDPNAPMTNLVEVPEIVADLNGRALLQKKVVVESLTIHGVRFGTRRTSSGALASLPPTAGVVTRRMLAWTNGITIPTLDLGSLAGTVIRVPAISADSLRSVRVARAIVARADSLKAAWEQALRGLDPRPTIDSAKALAERMRGTDVRRMNAVQLAAAASEVRATVNRVNDVKGRVTAVQRDVTTGLGAVRTSVASLDAARQADYAFARGLVNIPTLGAPDISMSLFGAMVTERLKPFMYWFNLAEQYIPPGLDPRRQTGPERLRMAGTDFVFPLEHAFPLFLVERAEADLAIGGQTAAAGAYRAAVTGATTDPALYGRPMFFSAERRSTVGPRELKLGGMVDRVGAVPRDSLSAVVPGVQIPAFPIPRANASLDLGDSSLITVALTRAGSEIGGTWRLQSDAVRWLRNGANSVTGPAPSIGSAAWAEALLWRAISTVRNVTIEARINGALTSPSIAISSNVGEAVSSSLKQAVGAEIQRAEQQVRAEVDRRVNQELAAARTKLTGLEADMAQRVSAPAEQLAQVQTELEQQLRQLTTTVPGIRLPNLPGIPRPRP